MIYKSRLEIGGHSIPYTTILPISNNLSVADIHEPGKTKGPHTKTITLPASPLLQRILEYPHNTTIESSTFNANIAIDAAYYVNEVQVFSGQFQLLDTKRGGDGALYYECSMVGETGNIFLAIAGLYLHDINFSDLDHAFTYNISLFTPTLGTGFTYGYIDYGVGGQRLSNEWTFEYLKPLIFEREYLQRMFADAGYSIGGSYINSTYAKSIVIPDVNAGALQLPAATVSNNQFYAETANLNSNPVSLGYVGSNNWANDFAEAVPFDNDSTGDFYDPGGVYNTSTFIFTPGINGTFNINAEAQLTVDVNMPAGAVTAIGTYGVKLVIQKSTNGGSSWSNVGNAYVGNETNNTTWPRTYTMNAVVPPMMVTQPCIFRVVIQLFSMLIGFQDGSSAYVNSGTASYDFDYTGTFGAILATANLPSGQTVVMNDTIPRDYLQLDFLTSIIKEEHLFIEPDKANPNTYIIEPREDFIEDTDPLIWTGKWDQSKETRVTPMGELDAKRYIFTRKPDKDFYNELYENEFKEPYGTEVIDVESDFAKGERKIESIFSPTPSASAADISSSSPVDMVAPRFWKGDLNSNVVQPMKCNIRRLYWGGLIDCGTHTLVTSGYYDPALGNPYANATLLKVSQYPFVGSVDHPFEPTVNLEFDNPQRIYWLFPGMQFTNNSRYNERYSKYLYEITHPDSKVVTMYMNLTARDIAEFSFRKKVFVKDTYYFVNEIKDFDPQEQKSIPVEFLKLKEGPLFVSMSISLQENFESGGMNGARTNSNMNMRGNYGIGASIGYNNINNDPNALVIGNNNNVG